MKTNMESQIKPDIRELEKRHRAYNLDMEYFACYLKKIIDVMPTQDIIVNLRTGEFEKSEIKPEWQEKIDKILEIKNEFVKQRYPEFYNV